MMILGALIYTIGLDLFLVPNSIIDGGIVGISLMAAELSGISFSIFVVLFNLPFLYLGYKVIGKGFTLSTLFSIIWMAIFSTIAHRFTPITTDPFLGAIFGGIILGIGVGLIIRNGGSLDGSEIVAIIFDKRSTFSVGEIVMAMNLVILGAAGFVYSWNIAVYSLIAYFIAYKMIDVTITGLEESKGVMIITDADNSKIIADALNANLNRGVTIMYGEGGYLKQPKHVLYSVVTRLEITRLKDTDVYKRQESRFMGFCCCRLCARGPCSWTIKEVGRMNNEWQYHLVKGISWLVCRLPYKLILLIGACLGPVYGLIAKKQKLRGINNIKIGMNMNDQEAEQLINKLFKNLGRSVMEVLYMPNLTKSFINKHIEMRGVEHLEKAIAEDKGVIVLTGHVGNWEWMGAAMAAHGYPSTTIVKKQPNAQFTRLMNCLLYTSR